MSVPIYNSDNPEQYLTDLEQVLVPLIERIDNYEGLPTPTGELFTQILTPLEESTGCEPCGSSSGSTP